MGLSRVDRREGGLLSAKREYLSVRCKEFVFDICGVPYGTGFVVSWWLGELPSGFLAFLCSLPLIGIFFGRLIARFIRPETYYKIDTANMFLQAIHASVLQVVDEMTSASRKPPGNHVHAGGAGAGPRGVGAREGSPGVVDAPSPL